MNPPAARSGSRLSVARWPFLVALLLGLPPLARTATTQPTNPPPAPFRAGAHRVDISPTTFPVRVNAMFTERSADKVVDPLYAQALVLEQGSARLALCVVDSCMVPRDLIDRAKEFASEATDIPTDRMLVCSTHTHSAPSAMGCLGSRQDPIYAATLPARIAEAIAGAARRLAPAHIGWTTTNDWHHTFNRRWIRRSDRPLSDPFGQPTVRANMHPGYQNPDAIGPSGPVDPGLSLIALRHTDGRPLALLANYSQHYYGSPLLSSDYCGRFAQHLAPMLQADPDFVGIMSQGTSGDLMWMDYGSPKAEIGYDAYARELAETVRTAWNRIRWNEGAELQAAQRNLPLRYRVPDASRLAWARRITDSLGERLPQTQAEIYAAEALHLHERQQTELLLQALRIGEVGITAIPNEVFALTGLKLKLQSPLPLTFNIALANGAEGYIPPPEQHHLGGYTTWPARTAGLEPNAEPLIVDALLSLLEDVAHRPRRPVAPSHGPYAHAILQAQPQAYWRLDEPALPWAHDASPHAHHARFEPGVALYLPGAGSGEGRLPNPALTPSEFSGPTINRAVHFAGGRIHAQLPLANAYSVELWLWNGMPTDTNALAGHLFSRGPDRDPNAPGDHLGIGGRGTSAPAGRLFVANGNARNQVLTGRTTLGQRTWHHVVFVRHGATVRVHLDGQANPDLEGPLDWTLPDGTSDVFLGGRSDGTQGFEGKLDEVAVFPRALSATEIAEHFRSSRPPSPPPPAASAAASNSGSVAPAPTHTTSPPPASLPLSPTESLAKIHLAPGFRAELVAAEPLTLDPVAIDWDAAGRLWVVEMADYPLGMDGQGQAGGRVRVLEDTDRDGRYDRSSLFADGLNFPNGLLVWRDGVLVTAAPEILFLRDTDGDGKADQRQVLVRGLQEGNQQLRANGLRWGLDNWVYCAAGGHHGNYGLDTVLRTAAGETKIGSRDFRFQPDTGRLEPESGPSQYGRNRDDWGHWFGTQNIRPLWHYVLPDRYLRRNPHIPAPDPTHLVVVPLSPKVWPASPQEKRYHSFDEAGHFTSACSGMIYRDQRLFPTDTSGPLHAFTCEPFHNLVQHNLVLDHGTTFRAARAPDEQGIEFFASEDRWCRPVMTRTGPDGALWVVDMYRYMIEHPEWLPAQGKAELLPHYRLGEDRGRIYRVLPLAAPTHSPPPRFDSLPTASLVEALDTTNGWQRDLVHRLLLQHRDPATLPMLRRMLQSSPNPLARVHALGILDGLGALDPALLRAALSDPHPGVRENALRLAESLPDPELLATACRLADDPSPKVRLQLALSLGHWNSPLAGDSLARLALATPDDPFLRAAVLSSAVPHLRALARAASEHDAPSHRAWTDPLLDLGLALDDRIALAALLTPRAPAPTASNALSLPRLQRLTRFLTSLDRRHGSIDPLATGSDALAETLRTLPATLAAARTLATNEAADIEHREAAALLLATHPHSKPSVTPMVAAWLDPRRDPDLQRRALNCLAATADDRAPAEILARWDHLSPGIRGLAVDTLLGREPWTLALLADPSHGRLALLDASRRAQLLRHGSVRVRDAAGRAFGPVTGRSTVLQKFAPALTLPGDTGRGRSVFAKACVNCHRLGNVGTDVGPSLAAVASHPVEKLLVNILDPNADIQPGYHAYHCELGDGTELYGLVAAETANSLTLKLTDGTTRAVLRKDITTLRGGSISLMPEGLESDLTPQDLADLIRFLRSPQAH